MYPYHKVSSQSFVQILWSLCNQPDSEVYHTGNDDCNDNVREANTEILAFKKSFQGYGWFVGKRVC